MKKCKMLQLHTDNSGMLHDIPMTETDNMAINLEMGMWNAIDNPDYQKIPHTIHMP